jgi:DNA invertase Pin-like site-specific DNA recombinase
MCATMTARIYLRVSSSDETDILRNQREKALEYARKLEAKPILVYSEVASGADEDRGGFNRLMKDIRKGDLVIFTSLSRMTRGGIGAALDTLRRIEARDAGWHFIETPLLNFDSKTPKLVKDIILAVLAAIDEDYRRRISEATKAKLAQLRGAGIKLGGRKLGSKNRQSERLPQEPMEPETVNLAGASRMEMVK